MTGAVAEAGIRSAAGGANWPALPVGVKNGIGVRVGRHLIVGLGSAGASIFALDPDNRATGWQSLDSFPGPAPFQPAAAVSNGSLFVFGGMGLPDPRAVARVVFDSVHRYDPSAGRWTRIETRTPAGFLGASAVPLPDGRIALVGGFNKEVFDRHQADLAAIGPEDAATRRAVIARFMSMPPEAYRWNDRVWAYDPAANLWQDLGRNPFPPNAGAAVAEPAAGRFVIVNGEIKPGLRTDSVREFSFRDGEVCWSVLPKLPAPQAGSVQEGLAGAFAGLAGGCVLVAGGANFLGARANAEAGRWFAHNGLTKQWVTEVFALTPSGWKEIGALPEGLAYGASFTLPEGVLLAGGEDASGVACRQVSLLRWDGQTLRRET